MNYKIAQDKYKLTLQEMIVQDLFIKFKKEMNGLV